MEETLHGAVRIHIIIRVRVMLNMSGGPIQGRALESHGATDQEEGADPIGRLETLVGQHSVVANSDSEGAESVADKENDQVTDCDEATPEGVNGINGSEEGNPYQKLEDNLCCQGDWLGRHKEF
jgi:hypothetical protein